MTTAVRDRQTTVTVTDLFCGAGGSSQGARQAGAEVRIAANHWRLAVESHAANFEEADHDCADISATDPRRYPTTTILWASPECTNHSQAKGISKVRQADLFEEYVADESAERSRATMWDVPRFAERHRYRYVVTENVVEAKDWVMFDAWLSAMHALGYRHETVFLNSMHARSESMRPAPQSRDRMYVVFWQKGERAPDLQITPDAWCDGCDKVVQARQDWKNPARRGGRYRAQYVYKCPTCFATLEPATLGAWTAIDWSIVGQRIGDRARPLAEATTRRIAAGIKKYARPLAVPVEGREGKVASSVEEVMRTQTTRAETGLAVPPMMVPAGGTWNDVASSVADPFRTRTTRDSEGLVVAPFLAELRGGGSDHRPAADPLSTVTASGNHHGLVVPPLLLRHHTARGNPGQMTTPVEEVARTLTASSTPGLVVPPLMMRNNSSKGDGAEMMTPVAEPMRTMTTAGHQSLVVPPSLVMDYYGNGRLRQTLQPLGTVTTHDRHALIDPGQLPDVDDCLFRMLEPHEIGAAMAFEADYVVLGNKRERVRMYGNAVTPPASALLLERIMAAMTGEAK